MSAGYVEPHQVSALIQFGPRWFEVRITRDPGVTHIRIGERMPDGRDVEIERFLAYAPAPRAGTHPATFGEAMREVMEHLDAYSQQTSP